MQKFLWICIFPAFLFSGCQRIQAEAMPADPQYPHIYDECSALSQEEIAQHNHRLEQLSSSRLMNSFIVITDNLQGSSPDQFALNYYQNYANPAVPDGFLLLINNDTNQDYFFTAGRCSNYITPTDKAVAISGATYSLIEADYSAAFDILLPLAERIPAFVLDQTASLTEPEIQEFADQFQSIQNEKQIQGALMLLPFPDDMESFDADAYRNQFHSDVLLLIDPQKKLCSVVGDVPGFSEDEFFTIWNEQSLPWAIRYFLNSI